MLHPDKLIKEEVRVLQAWASKCAKGVETEAEKLPAYRHWSWRKFTEVVFELHRPLIEAFGGWRYHGPAVQVDDMVDVEERAQRIHKETIDLAYEALKSKYPSHSTFVIDTLTSFRLNIRRYDKKRFKIENVRAYPNDCSQVIENSAPRILSSKTLSERYEQIEMYRIALHVMDRHHWAVVPIRTGQKLAPAVIEAIDDQTCDQMFNKDAHERARDILHTFCAMLFAKLGDLWSTTTVPVAASLSCAPSSFIRLGHYGEVGTSGGRSCYADGHEYECSKHILALLPWSYVGLYYRDKDATKLRVSKHGRRVGKVAGRSWGFLHPNEGALASNFYVLPKEMSLPALKHILDDLGIPGKKSSEGDILDALSYFDNRIYVNGDAELLRATPSFLKTIGVLTNAVRNGLLSGVNREHTWHDPCCSPAARKRLLAWAKSYHRTGGVQGFAFPEPTPEQVQDWIIQVANVPHTVHPPQHG